ncbi:MAG: hypothetical protein MZV63_63985 [Marinilabiliales bacterium]|nr:hypothetical protein [Marinilabiliales bacterium]
MSYNIRLFNIYEESEKNTHRKMLQLLKKEDPGILCLQEYFVKGAPAAGERKLKEALGGKLYTHFKLVKSGPRVITALPPSPATPSFTGVMSCIRDHHR